MYLLKDCNIDKKIGMIIIMGNIKVIGEFIMKELNKWIVGYMLPIIGIVMLFMYIVTFKNKLSVIFWSIFIIDRVIAFLFEGKFESCIDSLDSLSNETNADSTMSLSKGTISLIGYGGIGGIVLAYILFIYTRLFVILMLGEIMDITIKKILVSIN